MHILKTTLVVAQPNSCGSPILFYDSLGLSLQCGYKTINRKTKSIYYITKTVQLIKDAIMNSLRKKWPKLWGFPNLCHSCGAHQRL